MCWRYLYAFLRIYDETVSQRLRHHCFSFCLLSTTSMSFVVPSASCVFLVECMCLKKAHAKWQHGVTLNAFSRSPWVTKMKRWLCEWRKFMCMNNSQSFRQSFIFKAKEKDQEMTSVIGLIINCLHRSSCFFSSRYSRFFNETQSHLLLLCITLPDLSLKTLSLLLFFLQQQHGACNLLVKSYRVL